MAQVLRYAFAFWPKAFWYRCTLSLLIVSSLVSLSFHWGETGDTMWRNDYILSLVAMSVAMISYGAYRAYRYHPATDRVYREWLVLSPCETLSALPLGPVHLLGRDLFAVLLFTPFVLANPWAPVWSAALVFLTAYLLILARLFFVIRLREGAWCIAMGLALAAGLIRYSGASLLVLVVTYLLIVPVLRRSVSRSVLSSVRRTADLSFTLDRTRLSGSTGRQLDTMRSIRSERARALDPHARTLNEGPNLYAAEVGWPLAILGPGDTVEASQSPRFGLAVSALLSAWTVAILHHIPESTLALRGVTSAGAFLCYATCYGALVRLMMYKAFTTSPIRFAGRLQSGKILIWSHDRILIVPCLAVLMSLIAPRLLEWMGCTVPWAIGITVFVCTAMLIVGPPTVRSWIFTGHYRLTGARRGDPNVKRI